MAQAKLIELSFSHEGTTYIARSVDHRAEDIKISPNKKHNIQYKIRDGLIYSEFEIPIYALSPMYSYEVLGSIKFLHDNKNIYMDGIELKGGSLDKNWVIIKRNEQK